MRIHKVELEHVRNIKSVSLDLSAPLTIIAGRNGIGKSTLQQAILSAMFKSPKAVRDTLISRFDIHSKPLARITFSRDGKNPTIFLSRTLTDDNGEWREGNRRLKQKGKALEMVQDTLPISDDAAALLLWGRQEEMGEILKEFPSDGYSLLTAATVKGSGPDPQQIIDLIEKQIKETKRGGKKNPGSLTRANERVKTLEEELENALEAQRKLEELQEKYTEKKSERDQFNEQRESLQDEIEQMEELEGLLDAAVQQNDELSNLEERQKEWAALDGEVSQLKNELSDLDQEVEVLEAQYRVTKDKELVLCQF